MTTGSLLSRRTGRIFLVPLTLWLTGCGRGTAPPAPIPAQVTTPSVQGNWTGTQIGITDVNNQPFQYTAQFNQDGSFVMTGNWQGRNGPAGQQMTGTFTQVGSTVNLTIANMTALAAGQTISTTGFSTTGTVTADGKSMHVGSGMAEYSLVRS